MPSEGFYYNKDEGRTSDQEIINMGKPGFLFSWRKIKRSDTNKNKCPQYVSRTHAPVLER